MTQKAREDKADITTKESQALISAQNAARVEKTARLRELRLAREAESAASKSELKAMAPRKRKKSAAKSPEIDA